MLDSKCEALSCEAVVSLRALLQRRHSSKDSGLGSVLPHLVTYLEDLSAPTARASVVWMIGHYQQEVAKLAPDVVRRLAKGFAAERQEVKQQILVLGLKVWAFHLLNSRGEVPTKETASVSEGKDAGTAKDAAPLPNVTTDESEKLLPRLEAIVDHMSNLASFDTSWDVRDTARALKSIKESAKAALSSDAAATPLEQMGLWYCRACISGTPPLDAAGLDEKSEDGPSKVAIESTWMIGSLAQALDFPLESYRPLPPWAEENSSDELRKVKDVSAEKAREAAPKSISSSTVGNVSHMEQRVQLPSNINNMPVVQSLEDLDLFYSEAPPPPARSLQPQPAAAANPATLEQMRLAGSVAAVGTAVCGEDDESDEEAEEDDDDWKYCQQAIPSSSTAKDLDPPAPQAAEAPVAPMIPTEVPPLAAEAPATEPVPPPAQPETLDESMS